MYVTLSPEQPVPSDQSEKTGRKADLAAPIARRHEAGTHLFHENDTAEHVYEIRSEVLRLTRVLDNGRRQVIAFGLPGDIVGFPNGERHHTNCDVVATAQVIAHRRADLESGAGDPQTHQRLLRAALREITAMQDHFMVLARKSAMEKVASFLVALLQRTGTAQGPHTTFMVPMSRADIADFLGLTIETVSRMFSQLRKDGVIALDTPQKVVVRNMQALTAASQGE